MKKFIIYSIFLSLVGVVLALINDTLVYQMIVSSSGNSAYKMKRLFDDSFPDEIPLLGSSRAKENYVPSLISSKCFDYGENCQSFDETLYQLKHILSRPGRGFVMVNLDPHCLSKVKRFIGDYRFSKFVPDDRIPSRSFIERIPGIRFAGGLRSNFSTWMNERQSTTRVVDQGAMLLKYARTPEEEAKANAAMQDIEFFCDKEIYSIIEDVMAANLNKKTIVWVVSPVSKGWENHFKGVCELEEFCHWLERFPNNYIFDFRYGKLDLETKDFKDSFHLNYDGAHKFTKQLMDELRKSNINWPLD